ncbi:hypothetical protein BH11PLA2_BH11PLA2_25610 [soil metagenome]
MVGTKGNGFTQLIRPVIPIAASELIPVPQILRIVAPIGSALTLDNGQPIPGGYGDTQIFDLFVFNINKNLTVGFGPVAIFPTATAFTTGQGCYQIGPAGVIIYHGIEHWQLGILAQELFSVASPVGSVHQMIYQILVTRHFEKGWYLGLCNSPATINWLTGDAQFPVAVGIGRVFEVNKQPVNFSVTPTYYAGSVTGQPRFQIQFNFSLIYGK